MYVYFPLKFHLIVIVYDKNSKYNKLIYSACILLEINTCACIKITVTYNVIIKAYFNKLPKWTDEILYTH